MDPVPEQPKSRVRRLEVRTPAPLPHKALSGVSEAWDLVRRGDTKQGLALMQEDYVRDPSPSRTMTLGLGYLWTEKYQEASDHFQEAMRRYATSVDVFLNMDGVAKWSLSDPIAAVESWTAALDAKYTDAAGGVHSPLLLWVASVLRPDVLSRSDAEETLRRKLNNPLASRWPGALGQFVSNLIDESALMERSIDRIHLKTPPRRVWQIAFYKSILELERGSIYSEDFKAQMARIVDTSDAEWSEEGDFEQLLRNEEFYIARHMARIESLGSHQLS